MTMRTTMWLAGAMLVATIAGCDGGQAYDGLFDDEGTVGADGKADGRTPPLVMPKAVVDWEKQQGWGMHHLQWHITRRWDLLDASNKAWAQKQGWSRADLQEGTPGNGLEFIAMHRVMINMLKKQFPSSVKLFSGWETVPVDPRDPKNPLPHGATDEFDNDMLNAISRLETDLKSFTSDDDFGRFVETALRPTATNPSAKTTDQSSGLHNYLHNRFSDSSSPIDLGDPTVNLQNRMFWRLHGWLDARWTEMRKEKGLSDNDPAYKAAIAKATMEMTMHHCCPTKGPVGAGLGGTPDDQDVPESVRKIVW
jgi:hypothetical protein